VPVEVREACVLTDLSMAQDDRVPRRACDVLETHDARTPHAKVEDVDGWVRVGQVDGRYDLEDFDRRG